LKSATRTFATGDPIACNEEAKATDSVGVVIVNGTALEVPPPGAGLETVTDTVLAETRSEGGTSACTLSTPTNVVLSGAPFQFTTEVETNPVPFTVIVNPGDPGTALDGTRGWLTNGAGFDWDNKNVAVKHRNKQAKQTRFMRSLLNIKSVSVKKARIGCRLGKGNFAPAENRRIVLPCRLGGQDERSCATGSFANLPSSPFSRPRTFPLT
jgi:hypothetical protein